jgi:hypothetical protein
MRKLKRIKVTQNRVHLRCRKCGKKKYFIAGYGKFRETDIPTHEWNGWNLYETEICPICVMGYNLYPPYSLNSQKISGRVRRKERRDNEPYRPIT